MGKSGKPLFGLVMATILPPKVSASAIAAYNAHYGL
jgi:hypothetical protein